jgi:peptidyl-prolyl cis-trans isomerase D
MKPLIVLFVAAFILTMLGGMVAYVYSFKSAKEQRLAFKLNGETIDITDVERSFSMGLSSYRQNYGDKIDEEAAKTILLNNVVEQQLLKQEASKLKVKVSGKDVEAEFERIEAGFPEKEQFMRALQAQGYTRATLKNGLKDQLLFQKVREKIESQANVSDADVEEYFNENQYGLYLGKTLEESKDSVKEKLENSKKRELYNAYMDKLMRAAEYGNIKEIYAPYIFNIAHEEGEFKFSNIELANRLMVQKLYGVTEDEEAKKNAVESFKNEVQLAQKAIERGAKLNTELAVADQLNDLREQLEDIMMSEAEAKEEDVMFYFAENKAKYETRESADIELIEFDVVPSEADKVEAKVKAEEIFAKAKEQNVGITEFAEMAKEFSQGPSGPNGGDLGWFGQKQMVKEFEEAAFASEKGLVDSVVKTQFGYHLIFVEDKKEEDGKEQVKASHILIMEKAGEVTKKAVIAKVEDVKAKLENNEMKFEDAVSENSKLKESSIPNISRGGYVPGIGFDKDFSEAIFAADLDKFSIFSGERVILFKKTKYVEFEEANYDKIKDRVKYDYLKEKINKEMLALMQ